MQSLKWHDQPIGSSRHSKMTAIGESSFEVVEMGDTQKDASVKRLAIETREKMQIVDKIEEFLLKRQIIVF